MEVQILHSYNIHIWKINNLTLISSDDAFPIWWQLRFICVRKLRSQTMIKMSHKKLCQLILKTKLIYCLLNKLILGLLPKLDWEKVKRHVKKKKNYLDAKKYLIGLVKKIIEKSPAKCKLAYTLTCLQLTSCKKYCMVNVVNESNIATFFGTIGTIFFNILRRIV